MFEKAIASDPNFAEAYARLGWIYFREWSLGWTQDAESLERALELAEKAISLDDTQPLAHCLVAAVFLWRKNYDEAIAIYDKMFATDARSAIARDDVARAAHEKVSVSEAGSADGYGYYGNRYDRFHCPPRLFNSCSIRMRPLPCSSAAMMMAVTSAALIFLSLPLM